MPTRQMILASCLALAALAGCGSSDPRLMNVPRPPGGPDEFLVAPAKPLQQPPQPGALPPPTPGQANRADPTPFGDAVAALGGNPARVARQGTVPAADAGLIAYSSRYGRDPAIRQTLADEDLEWRRRNDGRLLERMFNVTTYYDAYESMSLDQQAEIERFRRAGVPTSAAPPAAIIPR